VPSVLLIDDHAMFREGLALALGQAPAPLCIYAPPPAARRRWTS